MTNTLRHERWKTSSRRTMSEPNGINLSWQLRDDDSLDGKVSVLSWAKNPPLRFGAKCPFRYQISSTKPDIRLKSSKKKKLPRKELLAAVMANVCPRRFRRDWTLCIGGVSPSSWLGRYSSVFYIYRTCSRSEMIRGPPCRRRFNYLAPHRRGDFRLLGRYLKLSCLKLILSHLRKPAQLQLKDSFVRTDLSLPLYKAL